MTETTTHAANANAADVIINRVSPARLGDPGPDKQALDRIIAAGLRAPDHGRLRPWKFLIIRGAARNRLGELMAESLRLRSPDAGDSLIQAEHTKPLRAPLIIVVAASPRREAKVPVVEQVLSAGAAAQNMLIAAHALGYGGFWRTGPAAYDLPLARALGLTENDTIIAFLYVGDIVTPAKPKAPDPENVVEEWSGASRGDKL